MCHKALHEVAAARRRTADAHTQGDQRGADACRRKCTRGLRPSACARHPYSKPKSVHRGATADNVGAHVSFDRLDLGSARPCSAPTHLISFRPGPYFRNAPNLRFYRVEQRSDVGGVGGTMVPSNFKSLPGQGRGRPRKRGASALFELSVGAALRDTRGHTPRASEAGQRPSAVAGHHSDGQRPRYLPKVHLTAPPWTLGRRQGPPLPPYLGLSPPR